MSKPPKKLVWAGAKYGAPKETLERAAAMYGALRALSGEDPSVSKPLAMLYGLGGLYDLEADDTRKRDELADAARTDFYKAYDRGEPDQADIANASVAAGRRFQFAMQQLNLESLFGVAGISKPSKPVPGYEDWTVEKIGQKLQQHQNRKRYPDKELAKTYALSEKDYKRYSTAFQMARACEDVIVTRATSKAVKREVPGFIEHLWKKQGEREYAEDGTRMETAA